MSIRLLRGEKENSTFLSPYRSLSEMISDLHPLPFDVAENL
jgi:hypothetical protein